MKAVGVLVIGLGLMMIIIGVQGTQHSVLQAAKGLSPKLRAAQAGKLGQKPGAASQQSAGGPDNTGGGTPNIV